MKEKNMFVHYVLKGGAVFLICITIIVSTLIISNGSFYIKNIGGAVEQNGKLVNTISVSGDGKVFAVPDMATLTISDTELATTSAAALDKVNQKMNQVLTVLKNNGIASTDIQTSNVNIYPQYDYTSSGTVLKGQQASVSLSVKVKKLDSKASKVTSILDQSAQISNIQIGSISFDIEDKTTFFSQARKAAFDKAKQKATELASLSSVKLLSPVSISDTTTDITPPITYNNVAQDSAVKAPSPAGSTSIQTGQLQVSVSLNVVFGIE